MNLKYLRGTLLNAFIQNETAKTLGKPAVGAPSVAGDSDGSKTLYLTSENLARLNEELAAAYKFETRIRNDGGKPFLVGNMVLMYLPDTTEDVPATLEKIIELISER